MWARSPKLIVLLGFFILSGCAAGRQSRTKGFEDARSTRAKLEASLAPRRWAVVIGINQYDDRTFTPLRFATKDANDIGWALQHTRYGAFDRVIRLTEPEQVNREALLAELSRLRNDLRRQDTLLVYFSGHGTLEFAPDGHPRLFLVARDTRSADLAGTAIELEALRSFMATLKPQRKVLVLDSCFAGVGKSRVSSATRQRLERTQTAWNGLSMTVGQSEAVLMASTMGGIALEDDSLGHGTYTWFLLRALTEDRGKADVNGDGALTAWEAHDYARAATLELTRKEQIPEGYFRVIGKADMFLSGTPRDDIAREAALVYAYGPANGLSLEVDGRAKGAFPKTVAIEPGKRHVKVVDESGRVVAENSLGFAAGQTWTTEMLLDALRGYRRFFGVSVGGGYPIGGLAAPLWGGATPGIALSSGYRVRGGSLRGLSLSFQAGWSRGHDGASEPRNLYDFNTTVVLRRHFGRIQLGAGWFVGAVYVPATGELDASSEQAWNLERPWLLLPGGPVLWQGIPLNRSLLFTLEARSALFLGQPSSGLGTTNYVPSLSAGIEAGF